MPKPLIIQSDRCYAFADYFKLNFAPRDILAYFDVNLQRQVMKLQFSICSIISAIDSLVAPVRNRAVKHWALRRQVLLYH